jgi:hypothetical protein
MCQWTPQFSKSRLPYLVTSLLLSLIFLSIVLADSRPAAALPLHAVKLHPIPAFARKYGHAVFGLPPRLADAQSLWASFQGQRLPDWATTVMPPFIRIPAIGPSRSA